MSTYSIGDTLDLSKFGGVEIGSFNAYADTSGDSIGYVSVGNSTMEAMQPIEAIQPTYDWSQATITFSNINGISPLSFVTAMNSIKESKPKIKIKDFLEKIGKANGE